MPAGALGLRHIAFNLPNWAEVERVAVHARAHGVETHDHPLGVAAQDPSRNTVILMDRTAPAPHEG
jgi:hypothetical protein